MDAESNDFQYEPLESDRHIRLLKIADSSSADAEALPYTVSLVHASLDAAPPFEAVSYAWGDPTPNHTLHLSTSGELRQLAITHSVAKALPYLVERAKETGYLWIDQLCINQKNFEERERQVQLMGDIYSSALRTLIWLGPEEQEDEEDEKDEEDQVVQPSQREVWNKGSDDDHPEDRTVDKPQMLLLIEAMDVADRYIHKIYIVLYEDRREVLRRFQEEFSMDEPWIPACSMALEALLERPWFHRGWVFQEYVLSRRTRIIVGSKAFTMESLLRLTMLIYMLRSTSEALLGYGRLTKLDAPRKWRSEHQHDLDGPFDGSTFCQLLSQAYSDMPLLTSDPRDRIFAFLGLWSPPDFRPNYHASVADVYTSFVRHTISATKSVEIITAAQGLQETEVVGLPSWVPDWTDTGRDFSLLLDQGLSCQTRWDAAKGVQHTQDSHASHHHLPVRGKVFDVVKRCATMEARIGNKALPVPACLLPTKRPTWQEFISGSGSTGLWGPISPADFFRVLSGWDGAGDEEMKIERTAEECVELFERHIIRKDAPGTENEDVNLAGFPLDLSDLIVVWYRQPFVTTTSGRTGMTRKGVEEGDVIFIIHGCRVPLILRKAEGPNMYHFVGDAYIEGAMYGELRTWEESEADDIILI